MRYIITLIISSLFSGLYGQEQGVITYNERTDIHRSLPEDRQQYKDMIPQFRTTNFELYYKDQESMYVVSKEQDADADSGNRGGMRFRMGGNASRDVYKNLEENRMVDSREFMTKQFLIKGPLEEFTWKIVDGQKMIMDFMCLKATYSDTADSYVVWFTPQISIPNGPAEYSGLPGMILEIDKNDGERIIKATEVNSEAFGEDIIKEPKKGKEVTSEEYREIVHEKMKEMRAARQRGDGHQIIIHN